LRRRELAKQRKEELADGAEGKEDAMRIQGGDESSSEFYSDAMDEDDTDARVCSTMCEKCSFPFNELLNEHRPEVLQWRPS